MIKRFILYVGILYVLISFAMVIGGGDVIDWVPEATLLQKIEYVAKTELLTHVEVKLVIAAVIAFGMITLGKMRKTDVR